MISTQQSWHFEREKITTTEKLIAEYKSRIEQQKQETQSRLQSATDHGIKYSATHRRDNLRMLRVFFNATQEQFSILLEVISQSKYSQLERGDQNLSSDTVRKIELDLGIPENWFDRDNSISLFLSQDEIALINEVRRSTPNVTLALANLMRSLTR